MSKQAPDPFQTIHPTALAQVSGGAAAASSDNEAVQKALDSILDSIKSISSNQNQGGFGATEMMMFMLMLQGGRGQSPCAHNGQQVPFTCGTGPVILK